MLVYIFLGCPLLLGSWERSRSLLPSPYPAASDARSLSHPRFHLLVL